VTGRIFLCGDGSSPLTDPNPSCPKAELHTLTPSGYLDWHSWASRAAAQYRTQSRCPGCGLYVIWSPPRIGAS
jgi:hypothetical protein